MALEITETAIVGDGAEVAYALTRLSQKGYSIEVDDFGAGYSSLGQLRHLPLETLKIDKSLIDDVHHSKIDTALVGAVIDMARALGMRTVAEGVELPEQERVLTRLGCDSYQGYLLGKPMPAARVPDWLAQRSAAGPVQAG